MNFFQKLTGSLKMPVEDELFSEKSPTQEEQKSPPQDEKISEPDVKTVSFEQMFKNTDNDSGETNITEEQNEDASNLVVPQLELAKAQTQLSRVKVLKKGLSKLRLGKKEQVKDDLPLNSPEGQLAIDVYETSIEVVIKSTIAGVKSEDLDVGIEDNTINIRGSRHNEEKVKSEDYFYQECYWGTFSRSVILPVEIDADEAQASLKDGILTIRLPKVRREKERKIKILS